MKKNTMPKECARTVTIELGGTKNLGSVIIRNCMPVVCAKTAILINIIR
jgi:hypothetical protein